MLTSIAEQTGGHASLNETELAPAFAQAIADLDHYFVVSFARSGPADGRFHPVQVNIKRTGVRARAQVVSSQKVQGRPCRTVKQEVVLKDGSVMSDTVRACRGPNGWEV
jgi:hypothetical protein